MIGSLWDIISYGIILLIIIQNFKGLEKVAKGVYIFVGILSTVAVFQIITAFWK